MNYYEVHCGRCNWWGMLHQLLPNTCCPVCESGKWLEYEDYSIERLEMLSRALDWAELEFNAAILAAKQAISHR